MSGKPIDLTGKKFGRLTVIEDTGKRKNGQVVWLCKCECGNETEVRSQHLKSNMTKSCRCLLGGRDNFGNLSKFFVEKTNVSHLTAKKRKDNTSGIRGVSWNKRRNKWDVRMQFQKKPIYLGMYDNLEDAAQARKEAEEKYFKPILEKYGKED